MRNNVRKAPKNGPTDAPAAIGWKMKYKKMKEIQIYLKKLVKKC